MNESDHGSLAAAKEIFFAALDQPDAGARAAFLDGACRDNPVLRRRVEQLLADHFEEDAFLRTAAVQGPATLIDTTTLSEGAGTQIGRYKLLERIGEGGFGSVWAAEQKEPVKRRVALKIIKLGMDTQQVVARFEAERQALALMDHPNIAKVLDAGSTETGRPFFVMELVKGIPITKYCEQEKLPVDDRLELFIKVCRAIQHAHQKGIIHRDIKPSNIMVTLHDGVPVPKVIDFGIAKATQQELTEKTIYTQYHQFIGTPAYMSPEQAEMSGLDIDTRSDIYSLGVLLYELLTGVTPFDAKELLQSGLDEMRRIIREREPVKPSTRLSQTLSNSPPTGSPAPRPSSLASDLDWIVMKCLEKDRQRRYDTANGLAADLKRHLDNEPVVARPPSAAYKFQKAFRRNKLVFTAGTVVALSLVAGISLSLWQTLRADREAARAVAAFDELRSAAPAFVEQARGLVAREQFDEAIEKLDYAIKLRPDVPEYLIAKGDLLQSQLKLAEAAAAYRAALEVQPGLERAEASAELSEELAATRPGEGEPLPRESLAKLLLAMQQQQRPAAELMPVARLLGGQNQLLKDYWLARLDTLPISPEKPLEQRLTVREDGRLALDLSDTKVTDLSPLVGAPLAVLNVYGCQGLTDLAPLAEIALVELNLERTSVADLAPLRAMHSLKKLNVHYTFVLDLAPLSDLRLVDLDLSVNQISNLAPLRGMSLQKLNLRSTRVTDLSPLTGMPLAWFNASEAPATDFSPLAGAPLEKCFLEGSPLRDLSFLRDSPVKELSLIGCNEARGYAVLQSLKSLDLLVLPQSYRSLPDEEFAAIAGLRQHPTLRNIESEYRETTWWSINTTQSKDDFWRNWDREQAFLPALRAEGLKFSLSSLPNGTYALEVRAQPVRDLSLLKDMPISELSLFGCNVSDLTPLRDMPLEFLNVPDNPIMDLSPLRGKAIKILYLGGTLVSDLTPLKDLPLRSLYLNNCPNVKDVAVLAGISSLEYLAVPMARNLDALRKLPRLQRLGFRISTTSPYVPETTPEEFWRQYEANRWLQALMDSGLPPSVAIPQEDGTWDVNMNNQPVADVELLRGAPISRLSLGNTAVADLTPLRGMPLRQLTLFGSRVVDLGPLQGMRLELLNLSGTQVTNLSVVRGMPLEQLRLHGCSQIKDLSPLAETTTLRQLTLPEQAEDFEFLRNFPRLERLSFRESASWQPDQTAAQFWRAYDEMQETATQQP